MAGKRLTFEQAKTLIDMEVLGVKKSYVCIDGLSKYSGDEYEIKGITVGDSDIIIKVSRIEETKIYITSYRFIKEISRMSIEEILEAYEMLENKVIEITNSTNVEKDVIGKKEAMIGEHCLTEGMKFILYNEKSSKYSNKILTVKYNEENLIRLVANRGRPKKVQ